MDTTLTSNARYTNFINVIINYTDERLMRKHSSKHNRIFNLFLVKITWKYTYFFFFYKSPYDGRPSNILTTPHSAVDGFTLRFGYPRRFRNNNNMTSQKFQGERLLY